MHTHIPTLTHVHAHTHTCAHTCWEQKEAALILLEVERGEKPRFRKKQAGGLGVCPLTDT